MAALHAVYYRAADSSEPVRDFLDALDDEVAATLALQIDRLNMLSDEMPHLPFPHTSQVEGELRELRCHYGRQLYRVLYAAQIDSWSSSTSSPSEPPRSLPPRPRPPRTGGRTSRPGWTPTHVAGPEPQDTTPPDRQFAILLT